MRTKIPTARKAGGSSAVQQAQEKLGRGLPLQYLDVRGAARPRGRYGHPQRTGNGRDNGFDRLRIFAKIFVEWEDTRIIPDMRSVTRGNLPPTKTQNAPALRVCVHNPSAKFEGCWKSNPRKIKIPRLCSEGFLSA